MTSAPVTQLAATFGDLLLRRTDDDRVALMSDDLSLTWRQLLVESRARAALMLARQGDGPLHVGVLLENTPEYVAWIYGAALARATVIGINPTRRGEALRDDIRHTDCQLVVTDRGRLPLIADLDLGLANDELLLADSADYLEELAAARTIDMALPRAEVSDRLLLLFTSGSTGAPKAVVCTTGRLAAVAAGAVVALGIAPDDVLYQAMPLFHGNAVMANLAPAAALGAPVALRRKFSASQFLPDVRRYGATYFNYVGRSLAYVLATSEQPDDRDNPLRHGFGTEASLRDRQEFTRRFGCELLESYGSSEGVISTYRPAGTPEQSIGLPQPRPGSDVAVINADTRAECPPAQFGDAGRLLNGHEAIGEIVDRGGAGGFEGYYRNEQATTDRLRDGWYWSGDLGYRDAAGFIYFAGRGNDWLRVDSENFASAPVETALSRYPDVVMAAVYATPDPRTGDEVMATFELRQGAVLDPVAFGRFLSDQADLGTKWAPRFIRLIRAMPLTATNKVDKAPLRREGWEVEDPVYFRPGADLAYVEFTAVERARYREQFAVHSRVHLLPVSDRAGTPRRARPLPQ